MLEMTSAVRAKASHHASPLRYPGGKAKLTPLLKTLLRQNRLMDCTYVEPFAGGAGAGLSLLLHGYVRHVVINDLSLPVYAFWKAAVHETEKFCDKVSSVEVSVDEWSRQREIFLRQDSNNLFDLGFSTFYLNRTNHSGVLNGGMIGGHRQRSAYGVSARFNRSELAARVARLGRLRSKITLHCLDAVDLLEEVKNGGAVKTLVYADPPYYVKGRDLYYDFYGEDEHAALRDAMAALPECISWIVSYDNVEPIRALYDGFKFIEYDLEYSVRNGRQGREVMFFSPSLITPERVGGDGEMLH